MKPDPVISINSDITDLARAAREFEQYLERVKAGLGDTGFAWYPYDSFASIEVLPKFLKDERRRLLKLAKGSDLLDAGAADGVLSFFFEHLGFRVDAIDHAPTNYNGMRGIRALQRALTSTVRVIDADFDSGVTLPAKRYGLAFCLGLLYHVKNPFSLLENLAHHAQYCVLSTRIAQLSPDHKTVLRGLPVAFLVDADELNSDATNHWIFSEAGLFRILKRTGWEICDYRSFGRTTGSDPVHEDADERAFCLIRSTRTRPDYRIVLTHGWHAIEEQRWRWTEARFGFDVVTDSPAAFRTLRMAFHLPPAHFARTGPLTLAARADGMEMPPQIFDAPGDHKCVLTLPAYAPRTALHVELALDRCVEPTGEDARELGIVVPLDAGRQIEVVIER
jgi:tRNA (mo5U34)-methyltransferase